MKKIILLPSIFILAACAPTAAYNGPSYIQVTNVAATLDSQPVEVKTLEKSWSISTSDFDLGISPDINTPSMSGFDIVLKNKTQSIMKIIWDDSVISYDTMPSPVFHEGIKYLDRNNSKLPTLIPPSGNLVDSAYPTKLAYFDDGKYTMGWKQLPIGKVASLLLAMEVNGKKQVLNLSISGK